MPLTACFLITHIGVVACLNMEKNRLVYLKKKKKNVTAVIFSKVS